MVKQLYSYKDVKKNELEIISGYSKSYREHAGGEGVIGKLRNLNNKWVV